MKLNLRSTIVSTALAVSLLAISRFQYHLPIKELFGEQSNYYMYIGISQFLVGAFVVISMLVLGFVLYSHREHLPKLSRTLSAQAAVIIGMIGVNLLWNIVYYCVGANNLPAILPKMGGLWLTVQYILLSIWLWQLACTSKQTFASKQMGKAGKIGSWGYIIFIIVWLVGAVLIASGDADTIPNIVYSILAQSITISTSILTLYWLLSYYVHSKHSS